MFVFQKEVIMNHEDLFKRIIQERNPEKLATLITNYCSVNELSEAISLLRIANALERIADNMPKTIYDDLK